MGFGRRLGVAFIEYGLIGSVLTAILLFSVLGYGMEDVRGEVAPYTGETPPEQYEIDSLAVIEFELVVLFAPLLVTLYRFLRYDHVGIVGEAVLFLVVGNNPVLGMLGVPLYAAAATDEPDDDTDDA